MSTREALTPKRSSQPLLNSANGLPKSSSRANSSSSALPRAPMNSATARRTWGGMPSSNCTDLPDSTA